MKVFNTGARLHVANLTLAPGLNVLNPADVKKFESAKQIPSFAKMLTSKRVFEVQGTDVKDDAKAKAEAEAEAEAKAKAKAEAEAKAKAEAEAEAKAKAEAEAEAEAEAKAKEKADTKNKADKKTK